MNKLTKDLHDVVRIEWLLKCFKDQRFNTWKPADMFHSKSDTKTYFDKYFDPYGDSFEEDLTNESLKVIFSSLSEIEVNKEDMPNNNKLVERKKIAEIENKYFPNESFRFGLFRLDTFYVDAYSAANGNLTDNRIKNSCLDIIEMKIKWHGGIVERELNDRITHCIIDKR